MGRVQDWVTGFLERSSAGLDLDRVVDDPPGVDAAGVIELLGDERLGPLAIEAMTDLMHPSDSMYFDAIFGAFHGQRAIRNWLVPTMREISYVEFVPTAPAEVFVRHGGSSSVEEWQMWAAIGEERVPLPRGVSTRHCADGWVRWNADVYDTAPMRRPPEAAEETETLPDPPSHHWTTEPLQAPPASDALRAWLERPVDERGPLDHSDLHTVMVTPELGLDPTIVGPLFHPTESRLFEPGGEYVGAAAIRRHLDGLRSRRTAMTLEGVGPMLFNGSCTSFEWVARAGDDAPGVRGTSVCRYRDGFIVHAADYYDTAAAGR